MADINLGQLAAATFDNSRSEWSDNVFKSRALLDHLKESGSVKTKDGGYKFRIPVVGALNSTFQAFSGTDVLDTTYQEGLDAAQWDIAFYNVSIVFTMTDRLQNKGKSQIADLLKGKMIQAKNTMAEKLNRQLFVGGGSSSKEIVGLDTIIAASGTVGSINGTNETWWASFVDSTSEALSITDMRTAKNTANNGAGGSKVSIIVTTQTLYEKYQTLLTSTLQMNPTKEGKRLGDAGFENVEFEGVPVVYDEQATSGVMYFINKDNYQLWMLDGADMQMEKKASPTNQHIDIQHIIFGGAAVTDRRASLAKLSGKTA